MKGTVLTLAKALPIRRMTFSSFSFLQSHTYLPTLLMLTCAAGELYMAISPDLFPRAANPAEK
jgi:hypothetical protein